MSKFGVRREMLSKDEKFVTRDPRGKLADLVVFDRC
jgi:hypothetical protein